jgi:uncharacterized RDD family membrane protein YckC
MSSGGSNLSAHSFVGALDVPIDLPLASVGSRALAVLIDTLVILLLMVALVFAAVVAADIDAGLSGIVLALAVVGIWVLSWGYFALFELAMGGQTPGKRIVGLRVVQQDGTTVGAAAVIIRNLLRSVDFLPVGYGVGALAMFLHRAERRIGDMAAGTLVVREDTATAAPRSWPAGLDRDEVALIEAYLERAPGLLPERREELAAQLMNWLRRTHPELAANVTATWAASDQVGVLFDRPLPHDQPGPG